MKTLKTIFAILTLSLVACISDAQETTQVRNVTNFSGIDVSEGIKVELTYGNKEFVEVSADKEYIDKVMTELNGDELDIYIKGNNWKGWKKHILVKVTAKTIKSIDVSSGASLTTQNLLESETLKMSASSGANMKVAFKAPNVKCSASSGASASLKGAAKFLNTQASSGAGIDAMDVVAMQVNADVSSGAHIKVHAEKELEADASSGGSLKYSGNPKMVDIDKSSGGSVRKAN